MKPPEKNIPDLKLERARLGPKAKSLIFLLGKEVKFEQIRVYSQSIQKKVFISMSYFVQAFSTVYPPTVYLVYALLKRYGITFGSYF